MGNDRIQNIKIDLISQNCMQKADKQTSLIEIAKIFHCIPFRKFFSPKTTSLLALHLSCRICRGNTPPMLREVNKHIDITASENHARKLKVTATSQVKILIYRNKNANKI